MNDSQQNATIEPSNLPPARIYQEYYHLTEPPFAITPDPEFIFFSSNHRQVLDKITYAIECRMGFILLTGEVGTGKTTLCRTLLDRLEDKSKTVYIINPSISGQELLAGILEDLGVSTEPDASKKELLDQLNLFLLADESHIPTVVIIDDAQTMAPETLEDLRLLSNLETDKQKLLQVVLSGQSELLERLESRNLRQLRQRIAIHCNLIPLPAQETEAYIFRRLSVAGNKGQVRFSPSATQRIHKSSAGIPRHINKICDYALTAGYVKDNAVIDCSHVKRALTELGGTSRKKPRFFGAAYIAYAAVLLSVAFGALFCLGSDTGSIEASMSDGVTVPNIVAQSIPETNATDALQRLQFEPSQGHRAQTAASVKTLSNKSPAVVDRVKTNTSSVIKNLSPDRLRPASFALQLGSYNNLKTTKRSIALYKQKGIDCHWQALNNGNWFRVVYGKFETASHASRFKSTHGLNEAMIIKTPFMVKVMADQPDISSSKISSLLSQLGYDCLMEEPRKGEPAYYTGFFKSVETALKTARRINAKEHLLAQVVRRQGVERF